MDALRGEFADKKHLVEEAESSRMETRRRAHLLELANGTLRFEWDNIQSTAEAKEASIEDRIDELEKENSELLERISVVEGKKTKLLERLSTSYASKFPAIPREQYEEWILAEARIEVIRELGQAGFVFETTMEEARVKAREARLACDYDSTTPQPDTETDDEGGVDQLEDSAWCDSAYNRNEEG